MMVAIVSFICRTLVILMSLLRHTVIEVVTTQFQILVYFNHNRFLVCLFLQFSWQSNPQAGSVYIGAQVGPQAPPYNGQMMGWDPSMQAGRPLFGRGAPTAYPGQTLPQVTVHQYPPAGYHGNPSAMTSQGPHVSAYGAYPNASSPGRPPAYYSK